jgi:hypothetical protein
MLVSIILSSKWIPFLVRDKNPGFDLQIMGTSTTSIYNVLVRSAVCVISENWRRRVFNETSEIKPL